MKDDEKLNLYFVQHLEEELEIVFGMTKSELYIIAISFVISFIVFLVVFLNIMHSMLLTILNSVIVVLITKANRKLRFLKPKGYIKHFFYKFGFFKLGKLTNRNKEFFRW